MNRQINANSNAFGYWFYYDASVCLSLGRTW